MIFDILTIFPGMFEPVLRESIIGRAVQNGILTVNAVNIRDFSENKHDKTDDYPYGGGCGMVMTPQPIYDAWKSVTGGEKKPGVHTIYLSPQGKTLTQKKALQLSRQERLVLLCGHYEGVDERVLELIVDEEISVGDYVLTGGELPAMVLVDCISRLIPGVLPTEDAYKNDSHFNGLLEFPQYTRPACFMGKTVPDILLSGHHANIEKWRMEKSLERTREKRPDLLAGDGAKPESAELGETEYGSGREGGGIHS